jgi:fluoride exporter
MRRTALVFAGGFCGTLARYALSSPLLALARLLPPLDTGGFPVDILIINLGGTLALGLLFGLVEHGANISRDLRLALGTGFLGAFTTFSTLAYGGDALLGAGRAAPALLYLGGSVALGVLCARAGHALAGLVRVQPVWGKLGSGDERANAPDDLPVGVGAWGEGD